MAFGHGSKAKVIVNGYDITAYLNSFEFAADRDVAEVSVLGDTSKKYVAGLRNATASFEGFFDGAASAIDEIFSTVFGATTPAIISYFPNGYDALSKRATGMEGDSTAWGIATVVSDAQKVSGSFQSNRAIEPGVVLHALAAETTDGQGTGHDSSASSANGGTGYIQVTAESGANPSTIKIQHSTDNITFADLITFTAITAAPTQERKEVTGTVNRYLRDDRDIGVGGSVTYVTHFHRKP